MHSLWRKICDNILAPSQLSGGQIVDMLTPAGRSAELRRHAASVIMARVQLIAGLFAILVPLCAIVDLIVFDLDTAFQLIGLRLLSAAIFAALAWPREASLTRPYTQALAALLLLLLVPSLFHLLSADLLARASTTHAQQLVAQLYAYLPTVVLGGLAIFPLTALEALLFALPVIGLGLGSALLIEQPLTLAQYGGTLWFMVMMLGVAMFSGMSQCHYMATLVVRAMHDPLTGAYTRQSGEEALKLLFRLNHMSGKSLTLAFFDLDRFKSINDRYGHEAGDRCLRQLADSVRAGLRRSDILIRWGGEEFVAALPDTPVEKVPALLQRLRQGGLGERPDGQPLTASIGVASSAEPAAGSWENLIQRADLRMYAAKQQGRDAVVWPDGSCLTLTPAAEISSTAATTSTTA
ncbi:diguanylate cyclase (GGDEF)-like protein [Azonexus fungiphilus]|uniref:diguanylate cyclase n=1 Tax=Azonexus fungiphilus TaxID=146940 RepID=A0A495WDF4_9RHOO|nr:GGDEF domain-containing protein [Azonexus fungiphilus]NHC06054.1 GGDEF domain-containing protein [Azonexus fungiphilus]RKT59379.1 diguanylate cyclase (GGDEF)-like protein [Azonexus fungiphilus]